MRLDLQWLAACVYVSASNAWVWIIYHTSVLASVVSAVAAVAVAVFTCRLTEANRIAYDQFISTHRPKVRVRAFRLHLEGASANHKYQIEFIYLNEGDSRAHIKEIGTVLIKGNNRWNYGARKVRFDVEQSAEILRSGEDRTQFTKCNFDWDSKDDNWFCIGYIEYQDDLGNKRMTGFCRRWNSQNMTWDRDDNEELEYSY